MNEINTSVLSAVKSYSLERAVEELERGGLVAFPTDTVYGVGAMVNDAAAVKRLYTAKGRPSEKAIPVLAGHSSDVDKVAIDIPPVAQQLMDTFWPGALTLILPKSSHVSDAVSAGPTIAVRMPNHPWLLRLLRVSGPLAVTSANISGEPHHITGSHVLADLNGRIDLLIDGGSTLGSLPSTLVDCTRASLEILRTGSISRSSIERAIVFQP